MAFLFKTVCMPASKNNSLNKYFKQKMVFPSTFSLELMSFDLTLSTLPWQFTQPLPPKKSAAGCLPITMMLGAQYI